MSAIAFAMLLIQVLMSFQAGTYGPIIDGAARFGGGHMQIQSPDYEDEPRIEHTLKVTEDFIRELEQVEGIERATPRAETYALVSNEERSDGALVSGVDPRGEKESSLLGSAIREGNYLDEADHAVIGAGVAKNLNLKLNSDLVILGSDKDGGMAASVKTVVGIFETGNAALDRVLVQITLPAFQEIFGLDEEAHRILLYVEHPDRLNSTYERLQDLVPEDMRLLSWKELMPDVSQGLEIDLIGNAVIYVILTTIIVLSIANTFVMTMFERTREFGMLMSIGIQRGTLFRMVLTEALFLWIVGVVVGFLLSGALIGVLAKVGIGVEGMEDVTAQYFISDRIYPAFNTAVLTLAPLAIGFGILVSASIAFLRLYRLQVVEALRDEE